MDFDERPPQILIVEDDAALRVLLSRTLREHGFEASGARTGAEMRAMMEERSFDLMVLDIMLPGMNGLDICRWVRQRSALPIIITSARGQETDRIVGLEVGADDYLSKPFGPMELIARIRAVLRRAKGQNSVETRPVRDLLRFDGWEVDRRRREVTAPDGSQVLLSGAEYDLLLALLESPQRVVGREFLLEQSRDRLAGSSDRSIDVLVSRLRGKFGAYDGGRALIKTVRGVGYIFTGTVAS